MVFFWKAHQSFSLSHRKHPWFWNISSAYIVFLCFFLFFFHCRRSIYCVAGNNSSICTAVKLRSGLYGTVIQIPSTLIFLNYDDRIKDHRSFIKYIFTFIYVQEVCHHITLLFYSFSGDRGGGGVRSHRPLTLYLPHFESQYLVHLQIPIKIAQETNSFIPIWCEWLARPAWRALCEKKD